jgi:hypothetical protein
MSNISHASVEAPHFSWASLACHSICAITVLVFEKYPFKPAGYQTQVAH